MFGKNQDPSQQTRQRRKAKHGRLVPVVSENTFLSTNKRGQGHDPDHETTENGDGLHLPKLANQRASLVAAAEGGGEGGGEGIRRRGEGQSRRLHSERIDRRVAGDTGDRVTRSDSAIGLDLARSGTGFSREKTDPPPQPIVVSIRNQDGEIIQKIPVEDLPPGTIPSEAFAERREKPPRKKREKKRRPRSGTGSASPSFSGSISISRETTLSGLESPDFFMSRLRSASWCECPDHLNNESRCGECRRVIGHEKWCVSRNTICQRCGKAFKRKYAHLERKSSFGTASTSGMIINSVPTSSSPSKNRHQSCSPSKSSGNSNSSHREGDMQREASDVRVRFQEDGKVVYPQWETFPDSGVEEDRDEDGAPLHKSTGDTEKSEKHASRKDTKSYRAPLDANVHKVAYDLALADARVKQILQKRKKKSKNTEHPKGIYFSYFPLLKRRRPRTLPGIVSPIPPPKEIGVRADSREGKRLKVKKGLKHILGDVKLGDYYPGGKHYPRPLRQRIVY